MKFKEIFEGNNSAYGQLILSGSTTDKGKAEGKAFIKRQPVTDTLWEEHLEGKDPALGDQSTRTMNVSGVVLM